ncbi:MAG: extracellular solute-binding protein, partial [Ktedonobacteraceae bacterium]|nr:extracellular solute-binding protein [Ktedonobacteraceae bacterium]
GAALTLLNACGAVSGNSFGTQVTYWNLFGGGDGVRMVQMQNSFVHSHPALGLEAITLAWGEPYYTKLAMAAAGGRPPDVAISHMSRVSTYAQGELLDPIDLDLLARHGIKADDFLPSIWEKAQYNGKIYAVPLDTHPFVMYYNKQVCQQAGLLDSDGKLKPLQGPDAVIDAFKKAQQVTGAWGLAVDTQDVTPWRMFYTLYSQLGGQIFSSDGKSLAIDNAKATQALSFMRDLTVTSKVASPTADYGAAVAFFGSNKAGFHWNGEWEVTTFQGQNMQFDMVPFPGIFGGNQVQADSHSFVIPHRLAVNPATRDAAYEFISSMLKDSLVWSQGGHIPAYLPIANSDAYKNLKPQSNYAEVAANVVIDPSAWFSGSGAELENQAGAAFQPLLLGQFTPQQSIDQFSAALQKLLNTPPPV